MNNLLLYKCETPLHAGGESSLGVVDMPIQREKHTDFPKIESSSIKGSFRCAFKRYLGKELEHIVNPLFGPENEGNAYSGSLTFSDGRIFLFPVKSVQGIFAWITCPYVIERFKKDLEINNINLLRDNIELNIKDDEAIVISKKSNLIIKSQDKDYIFLEEFGYKVKEYNNELFTPIIEQMESLNKYIKDKLEKDIVIVKDDVFSYFVNMSTEVNTRIKIGENGVVEKGKLFTEEYVPNETIMYNFVCNDGKKIYVEGIDKNIKSKEDVCKKFNEYLNQLSFIHFGGNTTLGKGILSLFRIEGENHD